ncbi:uncharacterized protein LOC108095039 [Drosophila ficusphila]|uniref:uncharacterized protein LOC108095039 n=1 Tax=Drosophila ficusphila TaxID=30025 RepID=UPI0007E7DF47|nr:uncharacterized protein LOC108095039 [Drosophila ficusphila]XP_017051420.1 uncharacterized protein LOC108095039 [Drosophila ficusphila]
MLPNGCYGWKEYNSHEQCHNSSANDIKNLNEKTKQNQPIPVIHLKDEHNDIDFPVLFRVFCDCKTKTKRNIRMIKFGRSRCHFLVSRCFAVAALFIIAATNGVYAQTEGKGFSNSSNAVLSNETNISTNIVSVSKESTNVSESPSISVVDQINENTALFQIKVQNKPPGIKSSSLPKVSVSEDFTTVSLYRNTLLNIESMLQRQLHEKAKVDSLESIKMHILMRLNLKKLPNITKPISVPQTILDNFYKDYKTSFKNTVKNNMASTVESRLFQKSTIPGNSNQNYTYGNDTLYEPFDESSSSQMQGDDANTVNEFNLKRGMDFNENKDEKPNSPVNNDGEEYESILSHISSIYIFPEQFQPHVRHNRKTDVLRFKIDSSYSEISYATLHLYLRGWDWINTNQPELLEEINAQQSKDIVVTIHRAAKRTNITSFTHTVKMFEFRHKIPSGLGQWVNVDLKTLFDDIGSKSIQDILIKGGESWMKPLVVTTDNTPKNPLTVHIEIGSKQKHRRRRNVYMDCTENDHDMRCCRYPLKVNFTSFGWHFVVAPTSFDAYFCSGDCKVGYLEQYPHTHLAALTTSATPCCSPTKMSSLSLLYFDDNHNLVLSVIPNMSVEGCSCS